MKRLSAILLVILLTVSYAQAGLILTVNGSAAPADPIIVTPGTTSAVLGMAVEDGSDVMYYHVAMSINGPATFDTSSFTWVTSMRDQSYSFDTDQETIVDAAQNLIFDSPVAGPAQLFTVKLNFADDFLTQSVPVNVELIVTDNTMVSGSVITPPTEIGSVSFVPEPVSFVLLAVGGLLLRGKRSFR